MPEHQITSVVVAIDTDSYAGNFEREMCAFATGQIGEYDVYHELVDYAEKDINPEVLAWIKQHIVQELDDEDTPCARPCATWPTPGRANNGRGDYFNVEDLPVSECFGNHHWPAHESVAIFFDEVPPQNVLDVILERSIRFANDRPDWAEWQGEKKVITVKSMRVMEPVLKKVCKIVDEVLGFEVVCCM